MTHKHSDRTNHRLTMLFAALAVAGVGCGGSDATTPPGGSGGSTPGGTGGSTPGGTGGSTPGGTGGSTPGGTGGSIAPDGGGGDVGPGASCPVLPSFTLGVHIVLDATWPATTATGAGTGKIHLWNRAKFNAAGTALSGETANCGTALPPFALNFAGQVVTGGSMVSIDVPNSVWDAPTIPKFPNTGVLTAWNVGASLNIMPTIALVGLTLTDSMSMWPKSYTGITAVDADGDGNPGFTAIPRQGGGFVAPPTGLGLLGSAPSADKVYLASRTIVALGGKLTSCTEQAGTATISFFDSHVVGCHVMGGGECTPAQVDFIDQSRTDYKVSTGVFTSKQVPETASCADVRAALPM